MQNGRRSAEQYRQSPNNAFLPEPISECVYQKLATILVRADIAAKSLLLAHRKRVHSVHQFFGITWHFKPSIGVFQGLARVWRTELQYPCSWAMLPYKLREASFHVWG